MALTLRNPHSVIAALETRPADVFEVRANADTSGDGWRRVSELASASRIPVHAPLAEPRQPKQGQGRVGGSEATVRERSGVTLEQLWANTDQPGLWLALDQLQDPHNVGAIVRTAAFYGVRGIVMTRDRSAPLTSVVYDTASGGMEYVPFTQVSSLVRAIESAKKAGLWVLGASEHASLDIREVDRSRSWLLVLGNEERGLRRLTEEHCDELRRLTAHGAIQSLNVSVAGAILIATMTSDMA